MTYITYQCDICKKTTEKQNNETHANINKCDITYKCVGKLKKVKESDYKTSFTVKQSNWVSRNSTNSIKNDPIKFQANINSGPKAFCVAVPLTTYFDVTPFIINFKKINKSSVKFSEYSYTRPETTTQVYGPDDSALRATLRFNTNDSVNVYVNGVKLNASEFTLGVNRVILIDPLEDDSTIKIVVYLEEVAEIVNLIFNLNESNADNKSSSWGNVASVSINNIQCRLFTCDDFSNLINNNFYVVSDDTLYDDCYFMVGNTPFSSFDRNLDVAVSLKKLYVDDTLITYSETANNNNFLVESEAESLVSVFPPIKILSKSLKDLVSSETSDKSILKNEFIS